MNRRPIRLLGAMFLIAASAPLMMSRVLPAQASGGGSCQTTDLAVTVVASQGATAGHEVYTATIENFGPCNATNLIYTDNLPNATPVTFTGLNPGSWDCSLTSSTRVACTLSNLSGSLANPTNPSTAVIAYDVALPTSNVNKRTTVAETHGVSIGADQSDPNPINNSLWGGLLQSSTGSQSFIQGSDQGLNPTAAVPETIQVSIPPGQYASTLAQIFDDPTSDCTNGPFCATVTTENGTVQTITFERVASAYPAGDLANPSLVPVFHELDNSSTFQQLFACPSGHKVPTVGCIVGASLVSPANSPAYYVITVSTPTNGHWV
jgi:uncharacterized repeat protein (TIGR01451 family)